MSQWKKQKDHNWRSLRDPGHMCDICVLFCELADKARMNLTDSIQCLLTAFNWLFFETNYKLRQQIHVK